MLISQRVEQDGDKLVIVGQHDFQAELDRVAELRSAQAFGMGDNRLVGSIPMELADMWLKEAGVAWHDKHAVNEVFRRKLLDGEFSKLRVHEGTF